MTYAIETRALRYRPGKSFALDDLSLHVPAGAIYGFLGPNGAGKTTTIRLLLGLLKPAGGSVEVLGLAIPAKVSEALSRIGYVPERPHLHVSLTVAESIRFHSAFFPTWDQRWASELLKRFGLKEHRGLRSLSKGEMGKLMITLALGQRPELLVLDEPTDGLDPVVRRELLSALLDYVSDRQATVFISSHLIHELERVCDWVGVLDQGKLLTEMPMQTFKSGIKRLAVTNPPRVRADAPFSVLGREPRAGGGETWSVRGWEPGMERYFAENGSLLREIVDLDLEEAFVELLRTARNAPGDMALPADAKENLIHV
ncbi:MAG: ABC transporter ATP-binding protein [Gemmatimonadota bacterium]